MECEFKNLIDKFLNHGDLPMRADESVQLFIQKYPEVILLLQAK